MSRFVKQFIELPAWKLVRAVKAYRHDAFAARDTLRTALEMARPEWLEEFWSQAKMKGIDREIREWLSIP